MLCPDHSRVVHQANHGSTLGTTDHLLALEYPWCDNIRILLESLIASHQKHPKSEVLQLLKQEIFNYFNEPHYKRQQNPSDGTFKKAFKI